MMTEFCEIPSSAISAYVWGRADKMLAHARQELKLPPVSIRWFTRADKLPAGVEPVSTFKQEGTEPYTVLKGKMDPTRPGEIWLRADFPLSEILHTLAHECCHVCSTVNKLCYSEAEETLSDEFAQRIVDSYHEDWDCYVRHTLGHDYHAEELKRRQEAKERSIAAGWDKPEEGAKDITKEQWFKEAARRQAEAECILERDRRRRS